MCFCADEDTSDYEGVCPCGQGLFAVSGVCMPALSRDASAPTSAAVSPMPGRVLVLCGRAGEPPCDGTVFFCVLAGAEP